MAIMCVIPSSPSGIPVSVRLSPFGNLVREDWAYIMRNGKSIGGGGVRRASELVDWAKGGEGGQKGKGKEGGLGGPPKETK